MPAVAATNALLEADAPIHSWYRFVLSFPPHLVRQYLDRFEIEPGQTVLDPFCGSGTTLVECRKAGVKSVGVEAHPMAALASRVKTNWHLDPRALTRRARRILRRASQWESLHGLSQPEVADDQAARRRRTTPEAEPRLSDEERRLLPEGFLSPRPLKRLLLLREAIREETRRAAEEASEFFLLALAHVIVNGAGNFAFGPEIYRTRPQRDHNVLRHFARQTASMIADLADVRQTHPSPAPCRVIPGDARELHGVEGPFGGVITSPPYPNEKDYTRTTRVESVLLGLVPTRERLRQTKETLLRSNTRNVFVGDADAEWVRGFKRVERLCAEIETRRLALGKTSGFERLYPKVVAHYFGGMRRHFRALRPRLAPGARCAYVVGDQLSFLMVHIPTAELLAELAEAEGFHVLGTDFWRQRLGTKVRNGRLGERSVRVKEEILLLANRD